MDTVESIAVVGMAGRFPGADTLDRFWANLVGGHESVTFWQPGAAGPGGTAAALDDHPDYVRAAPVLPAADRFDAGLFGMTPREAELCDPQLRIFLEICHEALEHSGYDPFAMSDSVGVFGATGPNGYLAHVLSRRPDLLGPAGMLVQTLNQPDYLATQVAYKLDLRGPAMTVLTACSSSLVTVHLACQALRAGECDTAVAGASVVEVPGNGYLWTPGSVLSRDGHTRPFDANATGTVFGSGAGAVVLKRLDDALADGDHIKAVIRGSAVNNDGAAKVSFSAPAVAGQVAVVLEALALAGVEPAELDYVEAHATGTSLGDPVEVAALAEAFGPLPAGSCLLGSVKSNVGHLGAAAGIAGLIKTVLMLQREAIPPTVNLDAPNPLLDLADTPFALATGVTAWPRRPDRPRIAGVTSLGIGGTNAHVVVEEPPPASYDRSDGRPRVVAWSARDQAGELRLRARLAEALDPFPDAVATLHHGRTSHRYRAAVVATSARDVQSGAVVSGTAVEDPAVAFLLPGQGSAGPTVGRGLYGAVRAFTLPMDECLEAFEGHSVALYRQWTTGEPAGQPLLFAVEYALARMWRAWCVSPVALLGHSLGELAAATAAGVFTLDDAVGLVTARAEAMAAYPVPGGMLAVADREETVLPLLDADLALAAVNGARQVVISGPDEALARLAERLRTAGVPATRTAAGAAFHHPGWAEAATTWEKAFVDVEPALPQVPLYSARLGRLARGEELASPAFWTGQLTTPVRFHDALSALYTTVRPDVVLEVGPGTTLTQLAGRHEQATGVAVAGLRDGKSDHVRLLEATARLWVAGCRIDWTAAGHPRPRVRVPLPGYPYDRTRYWADPPAPAAPVTTVAAGTAPAAAVPTAAAPNTGVLVATPPAPTEELPAGDVEDVGVTSAWSTIRWVERQAPEARETSGDALVLLPDAPDAAALVLSAVQRAGLTPLRVRHGVEPVTRAGEFTVRAGDVDDLRAVVATRPRPPEVLVHATTVGAGAADGFHSFLALGRLLTGSSTWDTLPTVVVLTSRSVDVSGGDPLDPARALTPALLRGLAAETPSLDVATVDVGERVDPAVLARELGAVHEPLVALRGHRRWVPVEEPLALPTRRRSVVRERGVYLITGGSGGLGLAVAKGFAGTGLRPTLLLLSRSAPAADAVDELRGAGAEVVHLQCDVTDADAVRTALTGHGPVNGLLHLAGVGDGGMIATREASAADAVLAPKVTGHRVLENEFGRRPPLDFAVSFSSRAAVDGLAANADYGAANAYLDVAAVTSSLAGGRELSIGWPLWRDVGMGANASVDIAALNDRVRGVTAEPAVLLERELTATTDWALDEHRVRGVPLLPGTAIVDLVVRALGAPDQPVTLADVVFRAPLMSRDPRILRVSRGPGNAIEVRSRPLDDTTWTTHVTCVVQAAPQAAPNVDLDTLQARFTTAPPTPWVDGKAGPRRKRLLTLGPRWRNIVDVRTLGDERLVHATLPAAYAGDLDDHRLHPALLDTVAATVQAAGHTAAVPFICDRLTVYGSLPADVWAHVRRDGTDAMRGDLEIVDAAGTVVVAIEGFTMRDTDEQTLIDGAGAQVRAAPIAGGHGIAPDTGVRLLLDALEAGLTGHVLVRPFENDEPVPLAKSAASRLPPSQPRPSVVPTAPPRRGAAGPADAPVPPAEKQPRPAQPSDPEDVLRALWTQTLGITDIATDQDFFDAGGNSLSAVELMGRIRAAFGVEMRIGLLLEARSFGELAAALHARLPASSESE